MGTDKSVSSILNVAHCIEHSPEDIPTSRIDSERRANRHIRAISWPARRVHVELQVWHHVRLVAAAGRPCHRRRRRDRVRVCRTGILDQSVGCARAVVGSVSRSAANLWPRTQPVRRVCLVCLNDNVVPLTDGNGEVLN